MPKHSMPQQGACVLALAVFCLAGCNSGSYEGHGLTWKLPRNVSFKADGADPKASATAEFSGGVQAKFYEFADHADFPKDAVEEHLEDIRTRVMPAAVRPISSRIGTLPAGKVARFVWAADGNRTLAYYLPGPTSVVVLSMTAPEGAFSGMEDHFDLSLGNLKFGGH